MVPWRTFNIHRTFPLQKGSLWEIITVELIPCTGIVQPVSLFSTSWDDQAFIAASARANCSATPVRGRKRSHIHRGQYKNTITHKKHALTSTLFLITYVLWRNFKHLNEYSWQLPKPNVIFHTCLSWKQQFAENARCRWFSFFIITDLEKFCLISLAHRWILCSEWVPSEWGSKQLIKASQ